MMMQKFYEGYIECFEFSAKINFTAAVVTCHFPSLVPFLRRRRRYTDNLFKL